MLSRSNEALRETSWPTALYDDSGFSQSGHQIHLADLHAKHLLSFQYWSDWGWSSYRNQFCKQQSGPSARSVSYLYQVEKEG